MFPRMMFLVALAAFALFGGSQMSAQGRGRGTPPGPLPPGQRTAVSAADSPQGGGHHGDAPRIRVDTGC